jgi:hypothetical protein
MATLKISDLSVGDWVEIDHGDFGWQPAQINVCGDLGIGAYFKDIDPEEEYDCTLSQARPIPITAEILEKNGWKLSKSNWFEFEDGEWKINIWIGKSKCNIEISQKREIYTSTYADIQVVKSNINTLQHALRLAGVDKEINL